MVHCHTGTQKLTEVYEIYPELTGEVLAHDIYIIFLVYASRNLQQKTKMTFVCAICTGICTGIHGTKYDCILQWMLIHRDPKRAAIAPLTKEQSWTDFCVQLTLGTYRNLSWAGVEQGGHPEWSPFHGNEESTALMQHKSTAILQWEKTASPSATTWTLFEETN